MAAQGNRTITRIRCGVSPVDVLRGSVLFPRMTTTHETYDNLPRMGFALGFCGLLLGLVVAAAALGRSIGFGVAPVFGSEAAHIQGQVQLFAGCVPVLLALVWSMVSPVDEATARLRPLLIVVVSLAFATGVLTMVLNWAIEMGYVADHAALFSAVLGVAVAILYIAFVTALPMASNIAVASQIVLRGGAIWLVIYAFLHLTCVAGRVFLDSPNVMWFFDTASVEMVVLGFVVPSALGLIAGALASVSDPRTLMRTLPLKLQTWHATVVLWTALRVWCIRFPGSYQKLVLALAGLTALVLLTTIIADTGVMQRLLVPQMRVGRRHDGLGFAGLALGFLGFATLILMATATMAAGFNGIPPTQLLSALLMLTMVGALVSTIAAVLLAAGSDYEDYTAPGRALLTVCGGVVAVGVVGSALMWAMTVVVERSLTSSLLGCVDLTIAGVALMLIWTSFIYTPPEYD